MTTDTAQSLNHLTLDDVRSAIGEDDPNKTNAGALRKLLGRGSLTTIQKHLETIRGDAAPPAVLAKDAAPAPVELIAALWSIAYTAAVSNTRGDLLDMHSQVAQQTMQLERSLADLVSAQLVAEEATTALASVIAEQKDLHGENERLLETARSEAASQASTIVALQKELGRLQQDNIRKQQLDRIQAEAVEATLRGELDRNVTNLADLRASFASLNNAPRQTSAE